MSRIESEALVVRAVEVGEADLIVTLVTEQVGKLGAIARGARKSKRLAGTLEPVHTIAVMLEDRGGELATLKEARVVRPRAGVLGSLEAMEASGVALRWARHVFPPRTPEPQGWRILVGLLDVLDTPGIPPNRELARAGLAMLAALGYALDLERCVVCGPPLSPDQGCVRRSGQGGPRLPLLRRGVDRAPAGPPRGGGRPGGRDGLGRHRGPGGHAARAGGPGDGSPRGLRALRYEGPHAHARRRLLR